MKWSISCQLCDFLWISYCFHTSPSFPSQLERTGEEDGWEEWGPSENVRQSCLSYSWEPLKAFWEEMTLRLISRARGKSYLFGLWWVVSKTNTGYLFRNASWAYSRRGCCCCQSGLLRPPSSLPELWLCPSLHWLLPFFCWKEEGQN